MDGLFRRQSQRHQDMPNNIAIETPDWEAAKASVASGVPLQAVAQRLGLDYEVLKKRAQRGKWSRPHLAVREARKATEIVKAQAASSLNVPNGSKTQESDDKGMFRPLSAEEKTGTIILESAKELAESGSLIGLKLLHGQMRDAEANPEQLAPLSNAKDLVTAINGMRKAAGLDRTEANLHLSLWGGPMSPSGTSRDIRDVSPNVGESGTGMREWED